MANWRRIATKISYGCYEQLGIAYAYLDREQDAIAVFDVFLTLDPGHLLSYSQRPRDIPLTYDPPAPWYRTWWVWAIAAAVAATATGVGVAIATDEPPGLLDGDVSVQ